MRLMMVMYSCTYPDLSPPTGSQDESLISWVVVPGQQKGGKNTSWWIFCERGALTANNAFLFRQYQSLLPIFMSRLIISTWEVISKDFISTSEAVTLLLFVIHYVDITNWSFIFEWGMKIGGRSGADPTAAWCSEWYVCDLYCVSCTLIHHAHA